MSRRKVLNYEWTSYDASNDVEILRGIVCNDERHGNLIIPHPYRMSASSCRDFVPREWTIGSTYNLTR